MHLMHVVAWLSPVPVEEFTKRTESAFWEVIKNVVWASFACGWNLQILGCELHQNAFGGRTPPGPAGGAIVLPQTS